MTKYWKYAFMGPLALGVIALIVLAMLPKPVEVTLGRATMGVLAETITAEGTSRFHDSYIVSAPISGSFERISIEAGDSIHEGERISQINPPALDVRQKAELQAHVETSRALVQEAEARVEQARLTHDQAVRDRARYEALAKSDATTKEAVENAVRLDQTASKEYAASQSRLAAAEHDLEAARSAMIGASTSGSNKSTSIPVIAPASGLVLRVIQRDARTVPAGTALVTIGDRRNVEIVIDLLSSDAPRVHLGDTVRISVPGIESILSAVIKTIEPGASTKISPLGIEERRVNVIASIPDPPNELGDNFRVDATITLWQTDNVLSIPESALFKDGADWAVYKNVGDKAKIVHVAIGHRGMSRVEILSGLVAADEVILHPSNLVRESVKITTQ